MKKNLGRPKKYSNTWYNNQYAKGMKPPVYDKQDPVEKKRRDEAWKKDNRIKYLAYKREWTRKKRAKIYREIAKLKKQIEELRVQI